MKDLHALHLLPWFTHIPFSKPRWSYSSYLSPSSLLTSHPSHYSLSRNPCSVLRAHLIRIVCTWVHCPKLCHWEGFSSPLFSGTFQVCNGLLPHAEPTQFSSLSHVLLFVTPWTAACQASLSINNSHSLLKLRSIESVMSSNHLILCHPLLFPLSIFPRIRVFSSESALHIRWPKVLEFKL